MSFDRLAPCYRSMERLLAGPHLHACRTAFLPEFARAQSILLLGEGHGRFLSELLRPGADQEILVVDSSAKMLAEARHAANATGAARRVRFLHADIHELQFASQFDAVTTHFFLDCFTAPQLERLVPKIAGWVRPGGFWHHADFQVPAHPVLALRARLVLALAYRFFQVFTRLPAARLIPPQQLLQSCGLEPRARKVFNFGLLYSELWSRA